MISFSLDEEQALLQDTARKFARDVLRPQARAAEHAGAVDPAVRRAFDQLGLWQLDVDEDAGPRHLTAALVHEELAWGDPGAAVALWGPGLCGLAVRELAGDEAQRRRLLAALQGGARGAVAYGERWKVRPAGFATIAVPAPGGYHLSGVKSFVVHAPDAELAVVFAQLDAAAGWDGAAAFAVSGRPGESAAYRPGDRHELLGLHAAPIGELIFEEHFVPEADRLRGRDGNLIESARRFLAQAQLVSAARSLGLARAAYEYALEYTQDRHAFGKPVAHFQAVSFTLADVLMEVESARWLLWRAAAAADQGRLCPRLCAQAAWHAAESAWTAADACVQLLGGAGYIQDFPAEKWLREAKVLGLLGGSAETWQQLVAESELGHTLIGDATAGTGRGLPSSALQPILT